MGNKWAGHDDFNTLDHRLIVGRRPDLQNVLFATRVLGNRLQQGPVAGRAVSELIIHGGFCGLDLTKVGYERIAKNPTFLEKAVG